MAFTWRRQLGAEAPITLPGAQAFAVVAGLLATLVRIGDDRLAKTRRGPNLQKAPEKDMQGRKAS